MRIFLDSPKVVVIIVIWNGIEDTLECLRSLELDLYPNKEIIIVDNASTDGSAARIRKEGFNVRILRSERNLGFTGGNNLGLSEAERSGAKYAFLLNNDTTVEPATISHLVKVSESRMDAGAVSPLMHYYDAPEEPWFSGAELRLTRGEANHVFPLPQDVPYETEWLSGCAVLVRMVVVSQIGGFDNRFYLTWEDVDWSLRMRKAGWSLLVVTETRILHKGGRSGAKLTGVQSYYAVRNSLLLAAKHAGAGYWSALCCVLYRHITMGLRNSRKNRREILGTTFEGLFDHWRGRYGARGSYSGRNSERPVFALKGEKVVGKKQTRCASSK